MVGCVRRRPARAGLGGASDPRYCASIRRARDQREDREGAGADDPAVPAGASRRDHPVTRCELAAFSERGRSVAVGGDDRLVAVGL